MYIYYFSHTYFNNYNIYVNEFKGMLHDYQNLNELNNDHIFNYCYKRRIFLSEIRYILSNINYNNNKIKNILIDKSNYAIHNIIFSYYSDLEILFKMEIIKIIKKRTKVAYIVTIFYLIIFSFLLTIGILIT